ncbi:fatty acid elongase 3-like [Typha angustifolia]|uniref:fatty acid elongase 3-like n=1 Tax=Typha angustifolia TaxID=59011 RepID=UPI003C3032EB
MRGITYWLAEHPAIVNFRWSHAQSFGSTWSFLVSSLVFYFLAALLVHLLLHVSGRRRPVPLGPLPAAHSLAVAVSSAAIFVGLLLSSLAEIRDSRWSWRGRSHTTPLQWLLCFPLGTRPSGRVFFWSYAFYLSRFLHLLRAFFAVLRRRRNPLARVFSHGALLAMSFLWLEFSQSFQVLAILAATLVHVVVFGYRFWVGVGLPVASSSTPVVLGCQLALLCCNLVCHLGVLFLHFGKGGCNGIGAWVFNSVLNGVLLWVFLHCYDKRGDDRGSRRGLREDEKKKDQ